MKDGKKSFTESVMEFIKGTSATQEQPPANPEAPATESTGVDMDSIYADLKTALDAGEVELEAGSITAWGKTKGLNDEQAADLASTVLDSVNDEQAATGEPTGEPDGDETEMQKSILKYLGELDGNVKEFKKSKSVFEDSITALIKQNKKLSQEVAFLKSSLDKVLKTPENVKSPATTISDIKPAKSREEIVAAFEKGILKDQVLMVEDQLSYLNTNTFNERSAKYMKEQGII